ncbi:MAG: acetate kinase, partial [Oscillospiraceae bacterium]|nr:acetate kinase [Oscillospiraceae bacterium]
MNVLVINCGSSSLKYQLICMETEAVLAKGLCDRIGLEGSFIKHAKTDGDTVTLEKKLPDHKVAIREVLNLLVDPKAGVISDLSEISAVGHRVVHGAEKFNGSWIINDEIIGVLKECSELAPLHNPPNITGILACISLMPDVPMVGVFDTAFHQTMPAQAYMYALPYEFYEKYKIRKYGFHGTSHKYVAERAAAIAGKPIESLKIVTCHLGNGSSICAVDRGKSIDTSMGFTPLEGLAMGTRCGSIDPALVSYIMEKEGFDSRAVSDVMNKKSGILGITGVSSDFRDVISAADTGNKRAKLGIDLFCYQVRGYIGRYAAAMGGLNVIVFTAGVGENNGGLR